VDVNRLTQKSQAALQAAQSVAVRHGHQEVDGEHLLLALLDQPDGLVPRLLAAAGGDADQLRESLATELERRPSVRGPGAEPGQVMISQRLARLLDTADRAAKRLKDEYVSVEHLLLALVEEGTGTTAGRLLAEQGVNRERLLSALTRVRGNQRVTSANPEVAYEALEKYGRDLVADARSGKLDPVIGRDEEIRRVIQILSRRTKWLGRPCASTPDLRCQADPNWSVIPTRMLLSSQACVSLDITASVGLGLLWSFSLPLAPGSGFALTHRWSSRPMVSPV
jgi:ATP-dependent Clp protease ATP-binding subunit ClpB